jgi:hypothetical protein
MEITTLKWNGTQIISIFGQLTYILWQALAAVKFSNGKT